MAMFLRASGDELPDPEGKMAQNVSQGQDLGEHPSYQRLMLRVVHCDSAIDLYP